MNWLEYEKAKAKQHRGAHVGGPGKPDYVRGNVKGEIKHRATPVTQPELKKIAQKGITEVDSLRGFTQGAINYANRYRPAMKLFKRGRPQ